ncbi:MAG: ATP-binding protein, partial [Desulfobacterales bacterium]|nr:ATP-binding protein [Desulfobacterales bacterium]
MAVAVEELYVTTDVSRDLLQSSGIFEHERKVVWEYVSNGLDYVDPDVIPVVKVHLDNKNKKITVIDNGRGMDFEGLHNFFTMHSENLDRKKKHLVRGIFGTGKSAAFGIAGVLMVTTIRDGKRSKVELWRKDVKAAETKDRVPVRVLEKEQPTSDANGTIIEIEKVFLKHIDQVSVIDFIQRHLAKWSKDATVFVNNQECEYKEPPVREVHIFKPEGDFKKVLGDVELCIKVSKMHLDEDSQGITIYSHGYFFETTLAGSERKDQANLIFGEIDVPELNNQDNADIPAYDVTRRMKLNKKNPLVQKIHAFIGIHVEQVRKKLVEEEQERKKSDRAKKLKTEASKIAEIINRDFLLFSKKLKIAEAKSEGTVDIRETIISGSGDEEVLDHGSDINAVIKRLSGGSEDGDVSIIDPGPGPVDPDPDKEN